MATYGYNYTEYLIINKYIIKYMQDSEINDIRMQFRGISFSGYKKTEVRNEFIKSMLNNKIESACHWCAELVCAGHYMDIWEIILHYTGKHIHLGNPKLATYLEMRYNIFRNIMIQGHYTTELQLRNNSNIRKLFAEVVATLCISNKKHSFEPININREEEFDMTQMTERLKAPNVKFAESIFMKEDPKELFIALNEFAYNISIKNIRTACYWIEWVIDFDAICTKRKQPCRCQRRPMNVESKFQRDIIWLIWDVLLNEVKDPMLTKIMKSVLELFCIKYTTAACKKRRYLLYFAVGLLTETVQTNIDIITDKTILQNVIEKINGIYKEIKKNEESPNTEYLFANLDKQNTFAESVKRMEIMDSLDFVPRNVS